MLNGAASGGFLVRRVGFAGYDGGVHENQWIASNLIAFDVKKDGAAVIVKAAKK
jgi:hypothetical protein